MLNRRNYMPTVPNSPSRLENLKWYEFYKLVSVEPTITLYMMAFMTTTVVEQSFFLYKACTVNHGYSKEICDNINEKQYKNISMEVQKTMSTFSQWNDLAAHLIPIILALFMGAWSDRRGRKLPLIMGLAGKLYYSVMIVVNALQPTWPVQYIIYTATLPSTITGADVIIFAAAYSYLSDITDPENRTLRITILEVCYLFTMPTGIALGGYLFNITNRSYAILFTINASLLVLSILYSLVVLKWQSNDKQKPLSQLETCILVDFFDVDHVKKTCKSLARKRPYHRRIYLIMFIFAMMFYTFQRDEKTYSYLFFQNVLHWSDTKYSHFRTFQSVLYGVLMLLVVPLMNRVFNLRDTIIIMTGATGHAVCRLIYIFSSVDWEFYLGAFIASIGPIVAPVLRSMTSKAVSTSERGCVFSVLSVADNAVPFISSVMYTQIYNATLTTYPQAIFWLTFATQAAVFILILIVHLTTTDERLMEPETTNNNDVLRALQNENSDDHRFS